MAFFASCQGGQTPCYHLTTTSTRQSPKTMKYYTPVHACKVPACGGTNALSPTFTCFKDSNWQNHRSPNLGAPSEDNQLHQKHWVKTL